MKFLYKINGEQITRQSKKKAKRWAKKEPIVVFAA